MCCAVGKDSFWRVFDGTSALSSFEFHGNRGEFCRRWQEKQTPLISSNLSIGLLRLQGAQHFAERILQRPVWMNTAATLLKIVGAAVTSL